MKIAVAGTGYVGLVTGVVLAHIGHDVTCVDIDESKIKKMQDGICPIYESELEGLMHENKERLTYTTNYKKAYKDAEVIFIGVGTPEREDGSANLDYVMLVAKQIAENVENNCVVVVKSTVPIGTNDKVEEFIRKNLKNKVKVYVASNPEFLAQGTAVRDTLYASRIVVGTEAEYAEKVMRELYSPLTLEPYNVPYLSMNRRSAEMVKYASNDFLALKISYINEIANFCDLVNANIEDVTRGMGYDSRIGNKFLNAGIGYGGSCFPKDTKALHCLSMELDCELKTVRACIEVNKMQKIKLFNMAKKDFGEELRNKNVTLLGVTFKPGTDDLREAPSIDMTKLLIDYGAKVTVYDPVGLANFKKLFGDKVKYSDNIDSAIKGQDIVFILTEWLDIKDYELKNYKKLMKEPVIYDGRNCYSLCEVKELGLIYKSIGR
jgi:UDPglucose 6-dehydrogenase